MNRDKYIGFKKMLAFVAAIGLWGVSMYFSYSGFKFRSTEILWFGLVLALVVTVVELVFNTNVGSLNPTLLVVGILCYIYGIYTNITGFYVLQTGSMENFFQNSNWVIPIFAGMVTEILPEALFAWGVGAHQDGDLVGNISDMFSNNKTKENHKHNNDYHQPVFQKNNYQPKHKPQFQNFDEMDERTRKVKELMRTK